MGILSPARYSLAYDITILLTLFQRMFQQLLTTSPPASPPAFSPNYFSSIPAGPGTAKAPSPNSITISEYGVPQPKLSNKARKRTDSLTYKGQVYSVGDWVHLSNPDDPMRPIVGQVYRTWISEEKCVSNILGRYEDADG